MMLPSSEAPESLASGVIAITIPAIVARITTQVVWVKKSVPGSHPAAHRLKAETIIALPSKKKREAKSTFL